MLKNLRVANIAIIDELTIEFGPGLNVLTGETGAGKSIIVDSLGLLLGDKASPEIIRSGCDSASVEAEIELVGEDRLTTETLARHEIDLEEGARILLRREVGEKRSKAFIQGRAVPIAILKDVASILVNIHGQHEHQALLDSDSHLRMLDELGGHTADADSVSLLAAEGIAAREELDRLAKRRADADRRRDYLEFQVQEISSAGLVEGEEEALRAEKLRLLNAEKIRRAATDAVESLYSSEGSAEGRIRAARKSVEEIRRVDPAVEAHTRRLEELSESVREISRELDAIASAAEADPARLDAIEERLYAIEKLKKKYGGDLPSVLASLAGAERELAEIGRLELDMSSVGGRLEKARADYVQAAVRLSGLRAGAATRLTRALQKELAELAMPSTKFEVRFEAADGDFCQTGRETAEFFISPNPGEPLKALAQIASGGELSRIMLALKNAVAAGMADCTLVFDEVDSGIGGTTADVVGRKLKSVASRQQILCVTHLPQIAAFAERHLAVSKVVKSGRTVVRAEELGAEDRVAEIARMMGGGGDDASGVAARHAREVLRRASARASRPAS